MQVAAFLTGGQGRGFPPGKVIVSEKRARSYGHSHRNIPDFEINGQSIYKRECR